MGRKGRPVKVKVAPRKPSLSVSSKEGDGGDSSSSSLVRAIASCLQPTPVVRPQISPMVSDNRVGLSWVSILKGGGSGSGALNGGGDGSPGASSPLKQGESSAHSAGGMEALNVPVGSSDVARSKPDESVGALGNRTVPLLSSQAGIVSSSSPRVIGKISIDDVKDEINFWENSVVCYVTSANPPVHVIDGFVRRIWKDLEIDKVGMVNKVVFLIRFLHKEHQEQACDMSGVLFDKKPFIVKPWTPSISYEKSSLSRIPIWVKLPKFDVRYWTEAMLCTIVGYLGTLIKVDNATITKSRMMFARVMIDMNVEDGFLEELYFSNEHD